MCSEAVKKAWRAGRCGGPEGLIKIGGRGESGIGGRGWRAGVGVPRASCHQACGCLRAVHIHAINALLAHHGSAMLCCLPGMQGSPVVLAPGMEMLLEVGSGSLGSCACICTRGTSMQSSIAAQCVQAILNSRLR